MSNPVKEALLQRELSLGSWIQVGHPAVAEILAEAGFDWIAVDCEHTDIDVGGFAELARAMYGREVVPLVRVRENDELAIRQVLDMGARGVIVPLVDTAKEAAEAVAAAKLPPLGNRGFSFCRGNDWGKNFDHYTHGANDEIAVVEGVDGVFLEQGAHGALQTAREVST